MAKASKPEGVLVRASMGRVRFAVPEKRGREKLSSGERDFLAQTFQLFREKGEWPTLREVERALVAAGHDAQQIALKVHGRYGDGIATHNWGEKVQLPLRAIREVPGGDEWYQPLVDAFPTLLEVYRTRSPEPIASSTDFVAKGWSTDAVRRLGQLLSMEFVLVEGSRRTTWEDWQYTISPKILQFAECKTPREYLDRRIAKAEESDRQASRWARDEFLSPAGAQTKTRRLFAFLGKHVLEVVVTLVVTVLAAGIVYWIGWA